MFPSQWNLNNAGKRGLGARKPAVQPLMSLPVETPNTVDVPQQMGFNQGMLGQHQQMQQVSDFGSSDYVSPYGQEKDEESDYVSPYDEKPQMQPNQGGGQGDLPSQMELLTKLQELTKGGQNPLAGNMGEQPMARGMRNDYHSPYGSGTLDQSDGFGERQNRAGNDIQAQQMLPTSIGQKQRGYPDPNFQTSISQKQHDLSSLKATADFGVPNLDMRQKIQNAPKLDLYPDEGFGHPQKPDSFAEPDFAHLQNRRDFAGTGNQQNMGDFTASGIGDPNMLKGFPNQVLARQQDEFVNQGNLNPVQQGREINVNEQQLKSYGQQLKEMGNPSQEFGHPKKPGSFVRPDFTYLQNRRGLTGPDNQQDMDDFSASGIKDPNMLTGFPDQAITRPPGELANRRNLNFFQLGREVDVNEHEQQLKEIGGRNLNLSNLKATAEFGVSNLDMRPKIQNAPKLDLYPSKGFAHPQKPGSFAEWDFAPLQNRIDFAGPGNQQNMFEGFQNQARQQDELANQRNLNPVQHGRGVDLNPQQLKFQQLTEMGNRNLEKHVLNEVMQRIEEEEEFIKQRQAELARQQTAVVSEKSGDIPNNVRNDFGSNQSGQPLKIDEWLLEMQDDFQQRVSAKDGKMAQSAIPSLLPTVVPREKSLKGEKEVMSDKEKERGRSRTSHHRRSKSPAGRRRDGDREGSTRSYSRDSRDRSDRHRRRNDDASERDRDRRKREDKRRRDSPIESKNERRRSRRDDSPKNRRSDRGREDRRPDNPQKTSRSETGASSNDRRKRDGRQGGRSVSPANKDQQVPFASNVINKASQRQENMNNTQKLDRDKFPQNVPSYENLKENKVGRVEHSANNDQYPRNLPSHTNIVEPLFRQERGGRAETVDPMLGMYQNNASKDQPLSRSGSEKFDLPHNYQKSLAPSGNVDGPQFVGKNNFGRVKNLDFPDIEAHRNADRSMMETNDSRFGLDSDRYYPDRALSDMYGFRRSPVQQLSNYQNLRQDHVNARDGNFDRARPQSDISRTNDYRDQRRDEMDNLSERNREEPMPLMKEPLLPQPNLPSRFNETAPNTNRRPTLLPDPVLMPPENENRPIGGNRILMQDEPNLPQQMAQRVLLPTPQDCDQQPPPTIMSNLDDPPSGSGYNEPLPERGNLHQALLPRPDQPQDFDNRSGRGLDDFNRQQDMGRNPSDFSPRRSEDRNEGNVRHQDYVDPRSPRIMTNTRDQNMCDIPQRGDMDLRDEPSMPFRDQSPPRNQFRNERFDHPGPLPYGRDQGENMPMRTPVGRSMDFDNRTPGGNLQMRNPEERNMDFDNNYPDNRNLGQNFQMRNLDGRNMDFDNRIAGGNLQMKNPEKRNMEFDNNHPDNRTLGENFQMRNLDGRNMDFDIITVGENSQMRNPDGRNMDFENNCPDNRNLRENMPMRNLDGRNMYVENNFPDNRNMGENMPMRSAEGRNMNFDNRDNSRGNPILDGGRRDAPQPQQGLLPPPLMDLEPGSFRERMPIDVDNRDSRDSFAPRPYGDAPGFGISGPERMINQGAGDEDLRGMDRPLDTMGLGGFHHSDHGRQQPPPVMQQFDDRDGRELEQVNRVKDILQLQLSHEKAGVCGFCHAFFDMKFTHSLLLHMCEEHVKVLPYICPICKETLYSYEVINLHMHTHDAGVPSLLETPMIYPGPPDRVDDNPLKRRSGREDYRDTKVMRYGEQRDLSEIIVGKGFKCKYCEQWINNSLVDVDHERKCGRGRSEACAFCHESYELYKPLKRHLLREHVKRLPFSCRICKEKIDDVDLVNDHMKAHRDNKKEDKKRGSEKSSTDRGKTSKRGHDGSDQKKEDLQPQLDKDIIVFSEKQHDQKVFQCQKCDESFTQLSLHKLKGHVTNHRDNDFSVVCGFCENFFTCERDLTSHLKMHIKKLPHKCSCGHASDKMIEANVHEIKFHLDADDFKAIKTRSKRAGFIMYCTLCKQEFLNNSIKYTQHVKENCPISLFIK